MAFQPVVLVLCCVIVAGLAQDQQSLTTLRQLVQETSTKENELTRENGRLRKEIEAKQHECQKKIAGFRTVENIGNQVFKDLIEEMKRLKSKLATLDHAKKINTKELDSRKINLDKLELELILQTQDIHLFSNRRLSKESFRCMQLANSSLRLEGRQLLDNYEFILLNHELKEVMGRLRQAENRNKELRRQLENDEELCLEQIKNLREEITEVNGEIEKAEATVARFKGLVQQEEQIFTDLRKEADQHSLRETELREKLRKQLEQLDSFKKDQECYTELRKDVIEKFL